MNALGQKVADFVGSLADGKLRTDLLNLHVNTMTQRQFLEDKFVESVIGIGPFVATGLTDAELLAKRRAILAINEGPAVIANAGISCRTEISDRKKLAQDAFQDSLRKVLSNADARTLPSRLSHLGTKMKEAMAKFTALGDPLTKKTFTDWISDTSKSLSPQVAPTGQSLKAVNDMLDATFPAKPAPSA